MVILFWNDAKTEVTVKIKSSAKDGAMALLLTADDVAYTLKLMQSLLITWVQPT
jgi:hypothetical protein